MSDKLKLMTVLGTRPEIIRLSAVIKKADFYFNHVLVHTGQNYDYELNRIFFDDLGLRKPDFALDCAGEDLGETMGNIVAKSYKIIKEEKPDAILILGDTNSALAAISAKRLKVPIFHMEAGNRCWDWNVPEMINRTIVDHISDINLPYTENSRRYLLSEGIDGKTIFITGSPMAEVLAENRARIKSSNVLEDIGIYPGKYFLLSAHREENIDNEESFLSLMSAVNKIAEKYELPIIYSTHPRSRKIIDKSGFVFHPNVKSVKPFSFSDYVKLQMNAKCVLSDSGTLTEESAILGFPAVLVRTSTERPEGLDKGSIVVGGITEESVLQSVEVAIKIWENNERPAIPSDYTDENVSSKVVKIIQSYTSIVNTTVWRKNNGERGAL